MISDLEQKQFQRFNRVALARVSEGCFRLPDEPPFWLLPFLDEGCEADSVVSFNDPFSFVANFLVEAEEHWSQCVGHRISSGVYSIQKGDSPELFYECHADYLHEQELLLVELLGEGDPGGIHNSVRAIRSGRLAGETALGQVFRYSPSNSHHHLNGLPAAEIILNNYVGVVFERYNQLYVERFLSNGEGSIFDSLAKTAPREQFLDRIAQLVESPRLSQWYINIGNKGECFLAEVFPEKDSSLRVLIRDVTDQYSTARWLENTDRRSAMSGLLNSVSFEERVSDSIRATKGTSKQLGLAVVKVDGLVDVSDTYGVQTANHFISLVVERILSNTDPICSVFHFHDDEFVVLLESLSPSLNFEELIERLRAELNQQYMIGFLTHDLLVGVGLARYSDLALDLDSDDLTATDFLSAAKSNLR